MTNIERREQPRFSPAGLKATVKLESTEIPVIMQGDVIDISYNGIKIKLDTPAAKELNGKIKIELFLPDSGIPLSISGILKHVTQAGELGLHYVDCPVVEALDSFMFECIKSVKN